MSRGMDANDPERIFRALSLQQARKRTPNISISNKRNPQEFILAIAKLGMPPACPPDDMLRIRKLMRPSILLLLTCGLALAQHELSIYELLQPETHKFAIVYDVTYAKEGAPFYLNPIRPGSTATDERVIDLATGKPLKFESVDGKTAKAQGLRPANTLDDSMFLKVNFAAPIPKEGVARFRIYKTYEDAPSYGLKNGLLVFDRPFGIKRNVIVLPAGYELVGCTVPSIITTQQDGRIRVSMLNDRDDQLPMKITGRRIQ